MVDATRARRCLCQRAAVLDLYIDSVEILDKYTLRLNTNRPNVALPTSVMRYPTVLMAPDAFETASNHPIGTGPFKFVSWTRWNETKLVRFENYWETDADGNSLPYLDEVIVKVKREDIREDHTTGLLLIASQSTARSQVESWRRVTPRCGNSTSRVPQVLSAR